MRFQVPLVCFFLSVSLLAAEAGSAQYYYKDLISAQQSSLLQQRYKTAGIQKISVLSYDPDGTVNKDFLCEQTLKNNFRESETLTSSIATGKSWLNTYFDDSMDVVRSVDSGADAITSTEYSYTPDGNLSTLRTYTKANDTTVYTNLEVHIWQYKDGIPTGVLRVKNNTDTTFVLFTTDTSGNITEESSVRNGLLVEHFYYYYDDQQRLTDIVRYNDAKKRMIPDYMFSYDNQGHLEQMTVVQAINSDYRVWHYEYGPNKLKSKALCYDKSHQLMGSLVYNYEH
jgi:antitoxin component YwqK of YwqJK toxin-antitoxin module